MPGWSAGSTVIQRTPTYPTLLRTSKPRVSRCRVGRVGLAASQSHPPAVEAGITDDERRTIVEMMAKGTYGHINLATKDLDGAFERLQARDAEVVQEPIEQPYGVRDCAFRDPAGNLVRISELR